MTELIHIHPFDIAALLNDLPKAGGLVPFSNMWASR